MWIYCNWTPEGAPLLLMLLTRSLLRQRSLYSHENFHSHVLISFNVLISSFVSAGSAPQWQSIRQKWWCLWVKCIWCQRVFVATVNEVIFLSIEFLYEWLILVFCMMPHEDYWVWSVRSHIRCNGRYCGSRCESNTRSSSLWIPSANCNFHHHHDWRFQVEPVYG